MPQPELVYSVSDFVAYLNQTLEFAYPFVTIEGELANFRVSKNRWVYFDLKDEAALVRCFGTVYQLPGPLEDGMVVRVSGSPRLHPQYNFSVNVQTIRPVGEGTIKRAADLLKLKLAGEGLFDPGRKRLLPALPRRVGLITAGNSAAYSDFIKITNARWRGLEILHADVLVQGEQAPAQIVAALNQLNELPELPDVIVVTRGGGSAEDLQAFSTEAVTRSVAASRVPMLVAIGHEIDESLAELAADLRASTPSNAAEMLLPDRAQVLAGLREQRKAMGQRLERTVDDKRTAVTNAKKELQGSLVRAFTAARLQLKSKRQLLGAYDPRLVLQRGYALVKAADGIIVKHASQAVAQTNLRILMADGTIETKVLSVERGNYAEKD